MKGYRKFGNVKAGGYDSKKESRRAAELKLLEKTGAISELKQQVRFQVIPKQEKERACHYVADFTYRCAGVLVVEDVKSPITRKLPAYVMKRKLMLRVHGIRITEV